MNERINRTLERQVGGSTSMRVYTAILLLDTVVCGYDSVNLFSDGQPVYATMMVVIGVTCLVTCALLLLRWGNPVYQVTADGLLVRRYGEQRSISWRDVANVNEFAGPPWQLMQRGLLYGPFLPGQLITGERVLEIVYRPGNRTVIREALVGGYGALREDVVRLTPRETRRNFSARYWHRPIVWSDEE